MKRINHLEDGEFGEGATVTSQPRPREDADMTNSELEAHLHGHGDTKAMPVGVSELLPCPFCGSTDIDPEGWATTGGIAGPACNGCQASVGTALNGTAENIAAWNRRARYSHLPPALSTIEAGPGAPSLQSALRRAEAYANEYEFDSDEGSHTPNDLERLLMLDMLNGLFCDEAFVAALSPIGGEAEPVAWRDEGHNLKVATVEHDDFSLVEIAKVGGKPGITLTIHRTSEDTGRSDDMSIDLTPAEAGKIAAALAAPQGGVK